MSSPSASRVALAGALLVTVAWGAWRFSRPDLVFGISTDDHSRILVAWAIRHGNLALGDVWAPLPTLVTGLALLVAPFPRVVPGLVNLVWAGVGVYAVARLAQVGARRSTGAAVVAAAVLGGSTWYGWLANSALAEPPYLALLALAAWFLARAETRAAAWPAVVCAAMAGACRYEGWAALALVPALVATLPGRRGVLVLQAGVLASFPAVWMAYHYVVNGDPLAFFHTVLGSAALDPDLSDPARVVADLLDANGVTLGIGAAAATLTPIGRAKRGLVLLFGLGFIVIVCQLAGVVGVHNGPRHHLVLLLALAASVGAAAGTVDRRRGWLLGTVAVGFTLATQLPRVGAPPPAHAPEVEAISVAAAALLEAHRGSVIIDIPGDEEAAFRSLIGQPERTPYAREDTRMEQWRLTTGRTAGQGTVAGLLREPGVLGVVTLASAQDGKVVVRAGEYVLVVPR